MPVRAFWVSLYCVSVLSSSLAFAGGVPDIARDGSPNIQSVAALVVDLKQGDVLFERQADAVRPIASISKLVGALVIQEQCRLDPNGLHVMTVANRDAAKGGDKSKLITGWAYSHRDLLHAALMRSDNRALPALGEACGMDSARFGEVMTERMRKLGLVKTFFREPNGLSAENVSTAREVLVFLREVLKVPELTEIMTTAEYKLTAIKGAQMRLIPIRSTDRLLTKNVATIMGGKTGYTDIARYCFAVAARTDISETEKRELGMVFLGAEGRHTRFADFTRVLKWLDFGRRPLPGLKPQPSRVVASPAAISPVSAKEGEASAILPSAHAAESVPSAPAPAAATAE